MKAKAVVRIYYNRKRGYIAAAQAVDKFKLLPAVLRPIARGESTIGTAEFLHMIKDGLKRSETAPYLYEEKEYEFWKEFGFKSLREFSLVFSCLKITRKEDICLVQEMKPDEETGYRIDTFFELEVGADLSDEDAEKIRGLLHGRRPSVYRTFELPGEDGALLRYKIDISAYELLEHPYKLYDRVYVEHDNHDNRIHLSIGNKYGSFSEDEITDRCYLCCGRTWKRGYRMVEDGRLYMKLYAIGEVHEFYFYVFKKEDCYFEILGSTDLYNEDSPKRLQLLEEFERVAGSVQILLKGERLQ